MALRKKTRIIVFVSLVVAILLSLLFGFYVQRTVLRNAAKTETEVLLAGSSIVSIDQLFCENGQNWGISNTPWWEQVYLSDTAPEEVSKLIEQKLKNNGYVVETQYKINNHIFPGSLADSFWDIRGSKDMFEVSAYVSSKDSVSVSCLSNHAGEKADEKSFKSALAITVTRKTK